jgi:hypothetical protein
MADTNTLWMLNYQMTKDLEMTEAAAAPVNKSALKKKIRSVIDISRDIVRIHSQLEENNLLLKDAQRQHAQIKKKLEQYETSIAKYRSVENQSREKIREFKDELLEILEAEKAAGSTNLDQVSDYDSRSEVEDTATVPKMSDDEINTIFEHVKMNRTQTTIFKDGSKTTRTISPAISDEDIPF